MDNFKTINDHPDMGLNNQICSKKDYFCKCHQIYLSEEDAQAKTCLSKMSFDMLSTRRCPNLVEVEK